MAPGNQHDLAGRPMQARDVAVQSPPASRGGSGLVFFIDEIRGAVFTTSPFGSWSGTSAASLGRVALPCRRASSARAAEAWTPVADDAGDERARRCGCPGERRSAWPRVSSAVRRRLVSATTLLLARVIAAIGAQLGAHRLVGAATSSCVPSTRCSSARQRSTWPRKRVPSPRLHARPRSGRECRPSRTRASPTFTTPRPG
jgi:hypothetical protein